ncbi:MAG: TIGR02147 family protein [Fibrobacteria bacterium]|nr:TIGR02147 family protein [Fibrobacteria bacterium]
MPQLIGHLDYREWLRAFYEERKAHDSFVSYRFLAERTDMDHSLLIKVMQGDRHLSEASVDAWIRYLRFDAREEDYFRTLVRFGKTRSTRERTQCLEHLLSMQGTQAMPLEKETVEYFRRWHHVALRGLLGLDGSLDAEEAAVQLDPPIGVEDARASLALLEKLQLIRREPDGRWALVNDYVEAGPAVDPKVIRAHQQEMMRMAAEAIDRHPPDHRQVSSATITLAMTDLPEARARIRALRDSLLRLSSESRTADQVFQFQTVLFPLTQVKRAPRRRRASR